MKKIRFYYWLLQSVFKKHYRIILIAAIVGVITTTRFNQIIKFLPQPKPTFYVGRVGVYTLSNLPPDIQSKISSGLTAINPDGTPVPDLAYDWKIIDDGKTYVFTLKDDLYWQDGIPLVSGEVDYSLQDVSVQTPDDKTIIFNLSDKYAPFAGIVSQPIFKRVTKSVAKLFPTTQIIGLGQYSITNIKLTSGYIRQLTLDSKTSKIIYRFYNTEKSAVTAFKLGDVDILQDMTNIYDLNDWSQLNIERKLNQYRHAAVFFNTQDPNLSQKPIRQALAYAIPDKPTDDTRAKSPISPLSWAHNSRVKSYDYSLTDAQELLTGFKTDFELELTTTPTFVGLAEKIKSSWEQLGFTVKIKVSNFPDTNDFQALLIGQQIPKDPDQYSLWHSTQSTNLTRYNSAKVDKLLEDGRKELDPNQRKIIYQDFQRFLLEDSPAAFLFYLSSTDVYRNRPLP